MTGNSASASIPRNQPFASEAGIIRQPARNIPLLCACDVLVCGGGPAGCAAALSARRAGARVLLLESQGQLGGMGTSGLVSHWLGGRTADGRWVVGGIFRELATAAAAEGIALLPRADMSAKYQPHGWFQGLVHGVPFDPFAMAALLDRTLAGAGVDVMLGTLAVDALVDGNRIAHVVIAGKGGLRAVAAKAIVDATGDADVAFRGGCETTLGRDGDRLMTPATLMFHVDNVDQDALSAYIHEQDSPRLRELIQRLRSAGEWPFPYEIFISVQLQEKGVMMINTSRLCAVDGTDPTSLSDAYRRGRAETQQLLAIMRKHLPGCASVRLKAVAPLLGVRETRRIVGDFIFSVEAAAAGTAFPDTVGWSGYGWDLPDPKRPSHQPMHGVKKPPFLPIPYRTMVPRPLTNLICPGRAVSVERDVLGPLRVMAPCMAMGEAAGLAASMVARSDAPFAAIATAELVARLRRQGAIIDPPDAQ